MKKEKLKKKFSKNTKFGGLWFKRIKKRDKKKDPLILPPQYEKLPLPGNNQSLKENQGSLKSILDKEKAILKNSKDLSNLEKQILRELKKNKQ